MTRTVDVQKAKEMFERGAALIDVRTGAEHRAVHIPHSKNIPLHEIDEEKVRSAVGDTKDILVHCKSGSRSAEALEKLSLNDKTLYSVKGGIEAWGGAGFNVVKKETHIKPLNQQVQIGASSMILLGLALYLFVTPWGLLLPLFAWLGLMNAGVTGVCGMSKLLVRMPWNK